MNDKLQFHVDGPLPAGRGGHPPRLSLASASGLTLLEMLLAMTLTLVVLMGFYSFIESGKREYVAVSDLTIAQFTGRAALDIFSREALVAGYSPLGVRVDPVLQGDAFALQLLADHDGDGVTQGTSELNENVTYRFTDPDGDGVFGLIRGVDLNGDGDFADDDESSEVLVTTAVPVDLDGDDVAEPFFSYDAAPPQTQSIDVAFGVRVEQRDVMRGTYPVVTFRQTVVLRNRR